jgi:hypothetical protein
METKICRKCNEEKKSCEFGKNNQNKDGLKSYCNECRKLESKLYRENNKEKRSETLKKYYKNNKEKELLRFKNYVEKNPEKRKNTLLKYNIKNREKRNEGARNWKKNQRRTNPKYRLINNLRLRTKDFIKGQKNFNHIKTLEVLGCSKNFLKEYLENKFTDGMTWDNYGFYGWHIDHIIPLSSAKTEEDVIKLCHYTNLQPLWSEDNLKKGSKII